MVDHQIGEEKKQETINYDECLPTREDFDEFNYLIDKIKANELLTVEEKVRFAEYQMRFIWWQVKASKGMGINP
jgi:hypothetical protein